MLSSQHPNTAVDHPGDCNGSQSRPINISRSSRALLLIRGSLWLCCLFFLASCQTANKEKVASAEPVEDIEPPTSSPQLVSTASKKQPDDFLIEYQNSKGSKADYNLKYDDEFKQIFSLANRGLWEQAESWQPRCITVKVPPLAPWILLSNVSIAGCPSRLVW